MQRIFFIGLVALIGAFVIGCSNTAPVDNQEAPDVNSEPSSLGCMMIVKFSKPEQKSKVIVGHPIEGYDSMGGRFVYNEDGRLTFNIQEHPESNYSIPSEVANFLEEQKHLTGTSPYIDLTDGYYLVDWKWQDIMPLSALTIYAFANAYHSTLEEHIRDHIFSTDLDWTELTDLNQKWDNAQYTDPVSVEEVYRVTFEQVDRLYNELKESDPYVCYNHSLYYGGLSIRNAWMYYYYDGSSECNPQGRYLNYFSYCDSLQEVYKEHLIEMIHNGQL